MTPLLVAAMLCQAPAHAEVIDRVMAVVEDQLILESDVRIEAMLATLDPEPSPLWTRQPDPVERVLEAAMFRALAGDVSLYQPTEEAVADRIQRMRDAAGSSQRWREFLEDLTLDVPGLMIVVRRRMVAEAYAARTVQVDQAEVQAWQAACDVLIEQVRTRLRIRVIPVQSAP